MADSANTNSSALRAYATIDRMQPQFAAFAGAVVRGDPPLAGMSQIYLEIAPGNLVFEIADMAVKRSQVRPGSMLVEREFGFLELHSWSPQDIAMAGEAILESLNVAADQRIKPIGTSRQIITNVDPYEAQLINRFRRGNLLVPGESVLIAEVTPAAYVTIACNEAEKAANVRLIDMSPVGRFGRMYMAGSESEVRSALEAASEALDAISGRAGP